MKTFCLLFVFTIWAYSDTVAQTPYCPGGNCHPRPIIAPPLPPVYNTVPPPVIYRPQVQWQPVQYQGSTYSPRAYRTPVRNWFFGIGTLNHYYGSQGQQ